MLVNRGNIPWIIILIIRRKKRINVKKKVFSLTLWPVMFLWRVYFLNFPLRLSPSVSACYKGHDVRHEFEYKVFCFYFCVILFHSLEPLSTVVSVFLSEGPEPAPISLILILFGLVTFSKNLCNIFFLIHIFTYSVPLTSGSSTEYPHPLSWEELATNTP